MYVKALVGFNDLNKNVWREAGDEFVVTKERFDEINKVGYAKINAPIVEEIAKVEAPKETPESRAKKAPAKRRAAKKAE